MTIGDKSAQSYGWSKRLDAAVPDGGSVVVDAPGFDQEYTDVRYIDVTTPSGAVYRSGKADPNGGTVDVEFDTTEPVKATVFNDSGTDWPVGGGIYVFCPHLLAEGANEWDIKGQIWDLQQRVSALEGAATRSAAKTPEPKKPEPHRENNKRK